MHPPPPADARTPRWNRVSEPSGNIHVHRVHGKLQAPSGLPGDRTVEVWYAPVTGASGESPFSTHPVSHHDLERAQRFRNEAGRTRFLSARRALRSLLAAYLSTDPGELALSADRKGKPHVASVSAGEAPIRFNVAHSGAWIILAFGTHREVGIDLEEAGHLPDLEALARRTLSPEEMEDFSGLPPELQHPLFFQAWTRKEAFLKALGMGLSLPPSQVTTGLGPEPAILRSSSKPGAAERNAGNWTVQSIPAPPGYAAAISFQGTGARIRLMEGPRAWLVEPRPVHGP